MSTIDSHVVEAKFDNKQFEAGAKDTLSILDKLKQALHFKGASKGLDEVSAASKRVSLAGLASGADQVARKFSMMSVAAVTAMATIVNKAVNAGMQVAKSFTIQPIMGGLREYELKLGSIQTILANTQASGAKLGDVNKALNDLNTYSDQTIYNFGEMARNIGTFTAAGVDLKTATASIKGIANLAALSGSNSQQASTAMYQLSQAISAGRVSLMDWNSVVNAGMGGTVFQRALAQTAVAMGKLPESAVKLEGAMKNVKIEGKSFRESMQGKPGEESWLSSEVLTTTLKTFTGDMKEADLVAQGFTKSQAQAIMAQAQTAKDAATIVKTGTQLMGTLKEAAESGWSQTWELIIGDFEEAKVLWTNVSNALGGIIQRSADARNKMFGDWKALGGREAIIQGISNAFNALMRIVSALKGVWKAAFPPKTGQDLANFSKAFESFTEKLMPAPKTLQNIQKTFGGVVALIVIAKEILGGVAEGFKRLFSVISDSVGGGGGVLEFTGNVGELLTKIATFVENSDGFADFFVKIADIIAVPIQLLQQFASAIGDLFSGFAPGAADKLSGAVEDVGEKLSVVERIGAGVKAFFSTLGRMFGAMGDALVNVLSNVGDAIGNVFTGANFDRMLETIQTGLFAGLLLLLRRFKDGIGVNVDAGGGLLGGIKDSLEQVTETLKIMQADVKANIILKIAIALGILTAAVVVLASIDPQKLARAMVALGLMFAGLQYGMVSLTAALGGTAALKLPLIAAGIMGIAAGMLLMAAALKIMQSMEFGDMLRGLFGLASTLYILQKAMGPLTKNASGMIRVSGALLILGAALNVIAIALKIFASMSWDEMAHGLVALSGALLVIIGAMRMMPRNMTMQAVALTVLSGALVVLGGALKIFNTMSWDEMAHGLTALAGALVIIAGALHLMPNGPMMLIQATALVAVAGALNLLGTALLMMGGMSWGEIARGLVTLGGSLLILAGGLTLMSGTLAGSAALVVAAAGIALLVPSLVILGSLDWGTILKSLVALAGAFVVLGAAGLILGPLTGVLIGLGVAMVAVGAGFALAGVGALAFATAFGIVASIGMDSIKVLAAILATFIEAIPSALKAFGRGIGLLAEEIANAGPKFFNAFVAILGSMLDAVITNAPKIGKAFEAIVISALDAVINITPKIGQAALVLLNTFLTVVIISTPKIAKAFLTIVMSVLAVLSQAVPAMARAGLNIMLAILGAIASKISDIAAKAVEIVANFITGIARGLPKIIQSGVDLIIAFIEGTAKAIRNNSERLGEAGGDLAIAIIEGMIKGLKAGASRVGKAALGVAKSALDEALNFLGISSPSKEFEKVGQYINDGWAKGLVGSKDKVTDALSYTQELIDDAMEASKRNAEEAAEAVRELTEARKKDNEELAEAVKRNKEAYAIINNPKATAAQKRTAGTNLAQSQKDIKRIREERDKDTAALERATEAQTEANEEVAKATQLNDTFRKSLEEKQGQLDALAGEYDSFTGKIEDASKALEDAIRVRDDYAKSIKDKYADLPEPTGDTSLSEYLENLRDRIDDTRLFSQAVLKLRNLGLSDDMYRELLTYGINALPFVQELLDGGEASVRELNNLTGDLSIAAEKLGIDASRALYQAGVDAATALLDGLKSQRDAIAAEMAAIAEEIARKMREITMSIEEARRMRLPADSGPPPGSRPTPRLDPVVDLTHRPVTRLTPRLAATGSYAGAVNASAGYTGNTAPSGGGETAVATAPSLTFNQYNTSPKALSSAELYRQTNNQLSVARRRLG